jgi:indolepyruvate ferredoxin oxidoreductase
MNSKMLDMDLRQVSLEDKYTLEHGQVYLTGIQALVRLAMMQYASDRQSGLNTAGFISGYRGSPLGGLDQQLVQATNLLQERNIRFLPAVNEELAATSIWGTQQAELKGRGLYDGVFGLWYGKGPGVDRSGDAFRHGNLAGSSKYGGVLVVTGDDHTAESSTTVHQSEYALVNVLIPVLNPAGVQDVIEFGLYGWALSRFSGCWVGLKCVHDTIESSASIAISPDLFSLTPPDDFEIPPDGLNIRSNDGFLEQEWRLHNQKLPAVQAFARANKIDRVMMGGATAHTGVVTTGKSYLDVRRAFLELGIDERKARQLGLRLYKVGMTWPLEPHGVIEFAKDLEQIIVIEEKRGLVEDQLKSILYGKSSMPSIVGKGDEHGSTLFGVAGRLEASEMALQLSRRLREEEIDDELRNRIQRIEKIVEKDVQFSPAMIRTAYFCAGCPHNSSTTVPEGSRALAGIGCHFMAQWMDRSTTGFTQMGGEGAGWVGESAFSKDQHVFQNIGDGTYFHSGLLAVRAAIAAGTNITFKILYNDAVAMTGGQPMDGPLDVPQITRQVHAEGVKRVVVVTDEPGKYPHNADWAAGVEVRHRDEITLVQEELRRVSGTSVLVYDQTCAAEKRRRRRRGAMPLPQRRMWIHEEVCEGCGDCGIQSNCVAVVPVETPLGRKRAVDQSACNMDYSCAEGFCPSFVSVIGGELRKEPRKSEFQPLLNSLLLEPDPSPISGNYSIVLTGVGGTGVVTVGALLGMAAHLAGKGCSVLDMAGLAQKGGAVTSHIILAETPEAVTATHVADGGANLLLGCDVVTAAAIPTLRKLQSGTLVVINTHQMMTGDFTRERDAVFPLRELLQSIEARVGGGKIYELDASKAAAEAFSDSIAANLLMLGYAYQLGGLPLPSRAIEHAIEINGRAIEMNLSAFRLGRAAVARPDDFRKLLEPEKFHTVAADDEPLEEIVNRGETFLTSYQDSMYGQRYRKLVDRVASAEATIGVTSDNLARAVARAYWKLLGYKDEYEVARLFVSNDFRGALAKTFESGYRLRFHLAPPIFSKIDPVTQRPRKREFGPWMMYVFRILSAFRRLRGTRFDPFGRSADRQLERRLIQDYESTIEAILDDLCLDNLETAIEIAALPLEVRGYGPVKSAATKVAGRKEEVLLKKFSTYGRPQRQAAG